MVSYYDELEIEDFTWDEEANVFHYPCPCGDRFEISKAQLRDGEEIATCPSCSLIVRVIYDYLDWEDYETSDEEGDAVADEEETPDTTAPSSPPNVENTDKAASASVESDLVAALKNVSVSHGKDESSQP